MARRVLHSDDKLDKRIEKYRVAMTRDFPGMEFSDSALLKSLVVRGLDAYEKTTKSKKQGRMG